MIYQSRTQSQKVNEESDSDEAAKESEDDDNEDEFEPSSSKKKKKATIKLPTMKPNGGSKQNGSSQKSPLATLVANRMRNNSNMRWINDSDSDDSNEAAGINRNKNEKDESQLNDTEAKNSNETVES